MDKLISPTEQKREEYIQERLEAFTMAAMKGFCSNPNLSSLGFDERAADAVKQARATLSELSKQK